MANVSRLNIPPKQWDHVGNLTPNTQYSESHRPHFDSRVAPWLPVNSHSDNTTVGYMSRYEVRDEDYITVSAGKVVAEDGLGYLVPAGLRKGFAAAAAGDDTVLRYTSLDVDQRVVDLGTWQFVTGAKSYTYNQLQTQLREMGFLNPNEALETFFSRPVGVAAYNYLKAAGTDLDNPATWSFLNYKMQDRVAIVCDYVVTVPHVPGSGNDTDVPSFNDVFSGPLQLDDGSTDGVWGTLASFQSNMDRYDNETNSNAVGLALRHAPLAANTDRTPLSITSGGNDVTSDILVREVGSVTALNQVGDFHFDYEVGVLWFFESGANELPQNLQQNDTIAFYDYSSTPSNVSTYASVVGELQVGDFVTYDTNSNFVALSDFTASDVTNPSTDAEAATLINQVLHAQQETLGQVLDFIEHPRDALERVRTAWKDLGTQDQMPGSASKGYPDSITYASAADREVVINLILR